MAEASAAGRAIGDSGTDRALRVTVPAASAEIVGAVLMDLLGPFEHEAPGEKDRSGAVTLVFYPGPDPTVTLEGIRAALPPEIREPASRALTVETRRVSRDWVDGWRVHFRPVVIGAVRIRPPWEPKPVEDLREGLIDVVINPGLGFGTGLHPTTRGVLQLLQGEEGDRAAPLGGRPRSRPRGPLVDAGTGSGVLAIAAAKLGWGPILAFDNDAAALDSARENIVANGVQDMVKVHEIGVADTPSSWFEGATVVANMTLEPVSVLLQRLGAWAAPSGSGVYDTDTRDAPRAPDPMTDADSSPRESSRPIRLVVSGILAGAQQRELLRTARRCGFVPGARVCEDEWVSLELLPGSIGGGGTSAGGGGAAPAGLPAAGGGG
jgi:ribosomal protein L11 methylase PrmA